MVEQLLECSPIPFQGATVNEVPDNGGVYLFSNRETGEALYVGQSQKGIRSRLKDHWAGTDSSDLARELVRQRVANDRSESQEWIKSNVDLRFLTSEELGMEVKWAEHFAIGALRPKLNK
ncbi:MAG: GIY-YIG nuclease family protein [Chloroflexota bacterium]|nr:GIY-YIG nuclease family protein [Chloroflexota bacterium]MDE2941439.1 GIY-YIG nuclease family protein [Chloroflexota bacterium]MDE3267643.1 GIY-YIG nuclease family protein [Chloroflexota bacterium]